MMLMIFIFGRVRRQHAVGINNSETLASKETGPFIATNGFIFVCDGKKRMLLSAFVQKKMQRVTEQNSADTYH